MLPDRSLPLLLIVSGPAGSGKTTLCDRMCAHFDSVRRVVTSTSRAPRDGEVDEEDYYFFTPERFRELIEEGAFYEHARVHDRYYGTLRSEIQKHFSAGIDLLLNIDVQGAESFRKSASEDPQLARRLLTVFVAAPDMQELERRLSERGQDGREEIERRLKTARNEMMEWTRYDYLIRSGTREEDFEALCQIYQAEKKRTTRYFEKDPGLPA